MNKFLDQIGDKLLPLANKLASNRYLAVLRDAFMLSFPLTMFGSIVVVFNNLPFFNDAMMQRKQLYLICLVAVKVQQCLL